MLNVKLLLIAFGMKELALNKTKEDGTYWAEVRDSQGNSVKAFVTKATDVKSINGNTPVTIIDGKYYIGECKLKILDTIKISA